MRALRAKIADLVRGDPARHYCPHLLRHTAALPATGAPSVLQRGVWETAAAVLEPAYQLAVGTARRWRTAARLPAPVVSVGNVVWGGTGKTPMVEYVARLLMQGDGVPVLLTRGVGGDEDEQLRTRLPGVVVAVGADRRAAAQRALACTDIAGGVSAFVLDDGLQVSSQDATVATTCCFLTRPPFSPPFAALGAAAQSRAPHAQCSQRHFSLTIW